MLPHRSISSLCISEAIGTYILVFFGVGSVHAAVLTGAQVGLWQGAIVWGVAISLTIYATGAVSGAHMNPAITIAFTAFRGFSKRKVLPYIFAQLVGAFLAAATLYILFSGIIAHFEMVKSITRGAAGSELSGMVYGEYFPNPAILGSATSSVSLLQAMFAECLGTAFLAFFIFALTDERNSGRPNGTAFAIFIGLAVSIIISIIAPLTQAGLNPARDFGPRLFAYIAGWKSVAIPGPRGGFFTVYILSPIIGALAGAAVYQMVIKHKAEMRTDAETVDAEAISSIR